MRSFCILEILKRSSFLIILELLTQHTWLGSGLEPSELCLMLHKFEVKP
jgi:hypothetical protein